MSRLSIGILAAGIVCATVPCWAQSPESDPIKKAQADALFDEGRALMAQGDCERALPKLEASDALESAAGTLLNLGNCYETLGRTASAWVTYRRAAALARARGQGARESAARERIRALEPELSYLKLLLPAGSRPDASVELDGRLVERQVYGSAFPVDPGKHTLHASRPGFSSFTRTIEIPRAAGAVEVAIPELAPIRENRTAAPPERVPARRTGDELRPSHGLGAQKTGALVAGGVGLLGIGAAGVFSWLAIDKNDESKAHCRPDDETNCTARGDALRDDARRNADVATASVIVGIAALGTGVVLWLTAPSEKRGSFAASIERRQARFRVRF